MTETHFVGWVYEVYEKSFWFDCDQDIPGNPNDDEHGFGAEIALSEIDPHDRHLIVPWAVIHWWVDPDGAVKNRFGVQHEPSCQYSTQMRVSVMMGAYRRQLHTRAADLIGSSIHVMPEWARGYEVYTQDRAGMQSSHYGLIYPSVFPQWTGRMEAE